MAKYKIEESQLMEDVKNRVLGLLKTPKTTLQLKKPNEKGETLQRANPIQEGIDVATIARVHNDDEKLVEKALKELESEGKIKKCDEGIKKDQEGVKNARL